jgi:hypothetical protein
MATTTRFPIARHTCHVDDGAEARRRFAMPPASGDFDGIELADLDPADSDHRHILIEAEHPEYHRALQSDVDEIAGPDGSPMNPRLHVAIHEIVANELWNGDPPEVWQTAERLQGLGYERHEILHMLAGVAGESVWEMLAEKRKYDADSYLAALAALPESWEKERAQMASARRPGSSRGRVKKHPKKGGRRRRR